MTNTNELKLSVAIQNIDVVDSINDNYMNISFYVDEERRSLRRAKPYIKLELYDKFTNDAINLIQDPNMD